MKGVSIHCANGAIKIKKEKKNRPLNECYLIAKRHTMKQMRRQNIKLPKSLFLVLSLKRGNWPLCFIAIDTF